MKKQSANFKTTLRICSLAYTLRLNPKIYFACINNALHKFPKNIRLLWAFSFFVVSDLSEILEGLKVR